MMAARFELALDSFIVIELAVDDDVGAIVFAGDWLVTRGKVDDAEARMAESGPLIGTDPLALAVRAAMVEACCCELKDVW